MKAQRFQRWAVGTIAIVVTIVVFLVPFAFIVAARREDTGRGVDLSLLAGPRSARSAQNLVAGLQPTTASSSGVHQQRHPHRLSSVAIMVVLAAMVGYVLQRRRPRSSGSSASSCWPA